MMSWMYHLSRGKARPGIGSKLLNFFRFYSFIRINEQTTQMRIPAGANCICSYIGKGAFTRFLVILAALKRTKLLTIEGNRKIVVY